MDSTTLDRFVRFSIATETITKSIQKYKNEQLASFGLKSMHLMSIYCLDKAPSGMTLGELAKACGVDKAFVSRITGDLRTMGYADYHTETEDGRDQHYKKRLALTKQGRQIMVEINDRISHAVEQITHGLSHEQLENFYRVLSCMNQNLDSISGDSPAEQ